MSVVLIGGGLNAFDHIDSVLNKAAAIAFPKMPDPIFGGDGLVQHVTVPPSNLPQLKTAAKNAGMYVLTDRWAKQRQGPQLPDHSFIR